MIYRHWSPASERKLKRLYPRKSAAYLAKALKRTQGAIQLKALKMGLSKSPEFMARACRFPKGHTPWNKGRKGWQPGGRAKATQFRKGNRPQTWVPVGSERVTRDGTLERKVANRGRWKPVKDLLWSAANGRIPRGRFVVHQNRDRTDFALSNLVLVDRAENMRRNTYHRYPKEIARLIQLKGVLQRQINQRATP